MGVPVLEEVDVTVIVASVCIACCTQHFQTVDCTGHVRLHTASGPYVM